MRGIRTRLAITLVVLVALTVAAIGIGVYAFVEASLRDRLLADARHQADFNLSVLLPGRGAAAHRRPLLRGQRAAGGVQAPRRRRHDRGLRRREPVHARGPARRARPAVAGPPRARRRGPARLCVADAAGPAGAGGRRPAGDVARPVLRVPRRRRGGGARPAPPGARGGRAAGRPRRADHRRVHRARHPPAGRRGGPRGTNDRRGRPHGAGARGRARRVRAVGRRVQPDGGHARDDRRPARERAAAEPAVRRGRLARAPDAAHRAGRRGVADRERHGGDDAGRAARRPSSSSPTSAGCGCSSTS